MNGNLIVAVSPHIKDRATISTVMLDVIIALLPAAVLSVYFYSQRAFFLILVCVVSCCATEYVSRRVMKRNTTLTDMSAVVTGMLLAFCLPPSMPLWMAAVGGIFSMSIGKQIFGGLGHNPFNPALIGRAFLQISWPKEMTHWIRPFDCLTSATPLSMTKLGLEGAVPDFHALFFGNFAGCLGETSKFLLLLGAGYLILRRHIKLYIPVSYLVTVVILAVLFNVDPLFHLLTGGLILGAFFMATDPVTSPISSKGKIIFGIGCGLFTMLIRLKGGFPEGVCYSILIMNMLTPLIDKITRIKRFGA
jgi:electron transport complex protein RnfD